MGATSLVNVTGVVAVLSAEALCAKAEALCGEVGVWAVGTTVTVITSAAAARIVRTLIPASTFSSADLKVGPTSFADLQVGPTAFADLQVGTTFTFTFYFLLSTFYFL